MENKRHRVELTQAARARDMSASDLAIAGRRMMKVVSYAETVQLVPPSREPGINRDDFDAAIAALARHQLARRTVPTSASELDEVATAALSAIEASPVPDVEWNVVTILGDALADLVGTSLSSMTRYRTKQRKTPDDVADRLHVIAQIVTDLVGSYNEYGVRRWFDRPRTLLDGRAPSDILRGQWNPEAPDVKKVQDLAARLTA